jgi:hypothetical protein
MLDAGCSTLEAYDRIIKQPATSNQQQASSIQKNPLTKTEKKVIIKLFTSNN